MSSCVLCKDCIHWEKESDSKCATCGTPLPSFPQIKNAILECGKCSDEWWNNDGKAVQDSKNEDDEGES